VSQQRVATAVTGTYGAAARRWAKRLGRLGIWSIDAERLGANDARAYVREVERLGFPSLWIQEGLGSKEIFAHAGLLLSSGERLVIATGIANMWARDAVAMANGARTLVEAYPDRFLLGIGVSHAPTVQMRGQTYERPVERMTEYLERMDAAPFVGPNRDSPPRLLAALGPRMLRLSRDRSLGALPYFVPVEHTAVARRELGPDALLAVEQAVVLSIDPAIARQTARRHMKRYLALDNYANNLRRLGWADADLAGEGSDKLVDAIVAWGDRDAIRERVEAHRARGADHVCLQPLRIDLTAAATKELAELAKLL